MKLTAYINGNQVTSTNGHDWQYTDGSPHKIGVTVRPCPCCNSLPADGEPDGCLGSLPGVKNACCGHGIDGESYIEFENGVIIRGTFRRVDR